MDLEVKARGKPLPHMAWYKDSKAVKPGKHYDIETLETRDGMEVESKLTVNDIVPSTHDGLYTIEAENEAGKVAHDVNLMGKGKTILDLGSKYI